MAVKTETSPIFRTPKKGFGFGVAFPKGEHSHVYYH